MSTAIFISRDRQRTFPPISRPHFPKSAPGNSWGERWTPLARRYSGRGRAAERRVRVGARPRVLPGSARNIPHRPGGAHGEFRRGVEGARRPISGAAPATRLAPASPRGDHARRPPPQRRPLTQDIGGEGPGAQIVSRVDPRARRGRWRPGARAARPPTRSPPPPQLPPGSERARQSGPRGRVPRASSSAGSGGGARPPTLRRGVAHTRPASVQRP